MAQAHRRTFNKCQASCEPGAGQKCTGSICPPGVHILVKEIAGAHINGEETQLQAVGSAIETEQAAKEMEADGKLPKDI